MSALSVEVETSPAVGGYNRNVARCVVVERRRAVCCARDGVRQLGRIFAWLLGDDVNRTANGRCTEEGRAATANDFHTFYHVGGYLFESVNAL